MSNNAVLARPRRACAVLACALLAVIGTAGPAQAAPDAGIADLRPVVVAQIPHDPGAYTEGLELSGGTLIEGTGMPGTSQLREVDPATGQVRRSVPLPGNYFGEGITVVGDRLYQLTYRDGVVLEWDLATLKLLREIPLSGESWGLCWDGARFVHSDGTSRLRFYDRGFAQIGAVVVSRNGTPVDGLNELECVDGQVWANVWPTDEIVRIDPASGAVTASVDAGGLLTTGRPSVGVLQGIAHVAGNEYLITGKYWPTMFRVRFEPV